MKKTITINFDMDGTIADLYGVENWLEYLIAKNTLPYEKAQPMLRFSILARKLNTLQRNGYNIAIISWLSKESSDANYDEAVTKAKIQWLAKHLPSVTWDKINIIPYDVPKEKFCYNELDILFDDNQTVREKWLGRAYAENEIMTVLNSL